MDVAPEQEILGGAAIELSIDSKLWTNDLLQVAGVAGCDAQAPAEAALPGMRKVTGGARSRKAYRVASASAASEVTAVVTTVAVLPVTKANTRAKRMNIRKSRALFGDHYGSPKFGEPAKTQELELRQPRCQILASPKRSHHTRAV
jgi:hypothetical protein